MSSDKNGGSNVVDFDMYRLMKICDRINENGQEGNNNYLMEIAREFQDGPKQVDD